MRHWLVLLSCLWGPAIAAANPPVGSYIFPAGAQRGTKVNVRVGGLFLHQKCGFEMLGSALLMKEEAADAHVDLGAALSAGGKNVGPDRWIRSGDRRTP